jgi:pyrroline-5-carboxylate reductase
MKRLVFFGAGNISQAIIDGLIDGGYSKENIAYVDRNKSNSLKAQETTN